MSYDREHTAKYNMLIQVSTTAKICKKLRFKVVEALKARNKPKKHLIDNGDSDLFMKQVLLATHK